MTKDISKEAAVAAEALLFDDWFDRIDDGVRARVRGFIETMLEAELSDGFFEHRIPASHFKMSCDSGSSRFSEWRNDTRKYEQESYSRPNARKRTFASAHHHR